MKSCKTFSTEKVNLETKTKIAVFMKNFPLRFWKKKMLQNLFQNSNYEVRQSLRHK